MRFSSAALALLFGAIFVAGSVEAQSASTTMGPTLTLPEAVSLATRNNPQHLQIVNNRRAAAWQLRSAWGNLLPSANASFAARYDQGGDQFFNGVRLASSDTYYSQYGIGLTYNLNLSRLVAPRLQGANLDAVEADITGSEQTVRALVAQQYLTALQAEARATLQDTLVKSAEAQLELARARQAVGAGTQLDVIRAQVTLGQQQVQAIQAHNTAEIEKLRLFQQMGVPQPANVQLTSTFTVMPPSFTLDSLLGLTKRANPGLDALRSRERVAGLAVRQAQAQYTPSLSISTGWGGNAYEMSRAALVQQSEIGALQSHASCMTRDSIRFGAGLEPLGGCGTGTLSDAQRQAIISENDNFPFNFTKQPFGIQAVVSLPIFNGFTREQQIQEAQAGRNDARYQVRARELQLTADVTAAYLSLTTAVRTIALQEQNAERAREELRLAEERYRVGAATFLEVTQSRSQHEQAASDLITAVYEYHKAFAALESAVGRPLR